jgi:hypothetical protein
MPKRNLIRGDNNANELPGTSGDDLILGLSGNDQLLGDDGSDIVNGGSGDDLVVHEGANSGDVFDIYDGGDDIDTLQLQLTAGEWAQAQAEVEAYQDFLATVTGPTGIANDETFFFETLGLSATHFENLELVFLSDPDAPTLDIDLSESTTDENIEILNDGDAIISTGSGDDNVTATGDGNYQITTGSGNDDVTTGGGNDDVDLGPGDDTAHTGAGDDHVKLGDGDDFFDGGDGYDTAEAGQGGGNDVIVAELVTYPSSQQDLTIDLTRIDRSATVISPGLTVGDLLVSNGLAADTLVGLATGLDIGTDVLVGVDDATAGDGNDTFYGNDADNTLDGGLGSDEVIYANSVLGYDIVTWFNTATITDTDASNGDTGQDMLSNIEQAVFSDATVLINGSHNDLVALDGSNGYRFQGDPLDGSGSSVSGAGDINGDGIDDVLIGAFLADPGGSLDAGESYLVFGGTHLPSLDGNGDGTINLADISGSNGSNGYVFRGVAGDTSGFPVSDAGDIDGDGVDDLIIQADGADATYVVFGGLANLQSLDGDGNGVIDLADLVGSDGSNGYRLDGAGEGNSRGVASADINNDGINDLIIGAPAANGGDGASYVVFGGSGNLASLDGNNDGVIDLAGLDGTNGFRIDGTAGDHAGWSVSGAGDINDDGIDDVIIGSLGAGESYVVFGGQSFGASFDLAGLDGTNGFRLDGVSPTLRTFVSSAGDIDGDGIDDVIIGQQHANFDGLTNSGAAYVVFGAASFGPSLDLTALDGNNGFRFAGVTDNEVGASVSGIGDFNGDGFDDLLIGATSNVVTEASYVVLGDPTNLQSLDGLDGASDGLIHLANLDGSNGFRLDDPGVLAGYSVSAAGDVNGDGFDDLIIGGGGESHVVFGHDLIA